MARPVHDSIADASETTPLITDASRAPTTHDARPVSPAPDNSPTPRQKWRVVLLLYLYAFVMILADSLCPAALIQILEDIICADMDHHGDPIAGLGDTCKSPAVQTELAFVRGFLQMTPFFAGVVCTVPYSLLANRIGRRRVLMLSGIGLFLSLAWVLAVCYFRFLPVRWIWLSGAFLFVGGGDPVMSTVAHVMITDTVERPQRAQIFLCLHAADVLGGFVGPVIAAALMANGHAWIVLLLGACIMLFAALVITSLIPETLYFSQSSAVMTSTSTSHEADGSSSASPVDRAKASGSLFAPLRRMLASNPQAILLLSIFTPQTAARELFNNLGLQYSNVKFGLSYARGNLIISLFQAVQGLVALVLLPFITRVLAKPLGWSPWSRDRRYAVFSMSMTAAGLFVIALAPVFAVEILGLLLVALGSCTNGLLTSLMGGAVPSGSAGAIYSSALTLSIVSRTLSGPIFSALLVAGFNLGWQWYGLPFAVMAAFMLCEFGSAFLIMSERVESPESED
ncbi:MFS general substrate transporter [Xylariaceae sp. FL1019]|nr:MFS general substrate transporter [Xylariaceae sp. FL1019]